MRRRFLGRPYESPLERLSVVVTESGVVTVGVVKSPAAMGELCRPLFVARTSSAEGSGVLMGVAAAAAAVGSSPLPTDLLPRRSDVLLATSDGTDVVRDLSTLAVGVASSSSSGGSSVLTWQTELRLRVAIGHPETL